MAEIHHRIVVRAPRDAALRALTTAEGLRAWWCADASARPEEGSTAELRFAEGAVVIRMKVVALRPELVHWQCVAGPDEWEGTDITFELGRADNGGVVLSFAHSGWGTAEQSLPQCSYDWSHFLTSLKRFLESGTGMPYPFYQTMGQFIGGASSMSDANKAVVRRLYEEVMGKGNMKVADQIFAPNYVDHMPIMETPDRAGLLKSVDAARRAFPEVKPRLIAEATEGEWVAIAVQVDAGRHQGTYMGVPATGRPVTWTETHFWRVSDGRIAEHHGNVGLFEIHRVIGSHDLESKLK